MYTHFIFDLDQTVIDSTHRLGDGSLADWIANNTPRNILLDRELPYAKIMRDSIADGFDVIACTSRVMGKLDHAWLDLHRLVAPTILSRDPSDQRGCGELKLSALTALCVSRGLAWSDFAKRAIMFDDSFDVQTILKNAGLRVIDPVKYNSHLIRKSI